MAIKVGGVLVDIPKPVRCFQRYTHDQRADMMASHRLGFRQKERVGEFFWIHQYVPDRAFPTRGAAIRAALATLSHD